ncbi:MAG TPA: CBS domain-containing protein [Bacteroidia bacterium]|jgi:acetoin utilization protein AcuB|nr:CBS domain-containing protein [Bacteroidia bacterium]
MLARDLISLDVPPLTLHDDAKRALEWMDEFKVSHLPVIEKTNYIGIVSDMEIIDLVSPTEHLSKLRKALGKPFVFEYQHAYEALKLYDLLKITLIPVLDERERYIGVITQQKLLSYFSEMTDAKDPGSLIVLELNQVDYSLSQIAQIVESNGAKVLSLFITPQHDSTELDVTLKINLQDASAVLQTLERYGYRVRESYTQGNSKKNLIDRYDSLMHYLNI